MARIMAWGCAIVVIAASVAAFISERLDTLNFFDDVQASFSDACTPVRGAIAPGVIHIDRLTRRAFIGALEQGKSRRGVIYSASLDDPLDAAGWQDQTGGAPVRFSPRAIDLFRSRDAAARADEPTGGVLFVANIAAKTIDAFTVNGASALEYRESYVERRLTAPVGVAAVGGNAFYAVVDPGAANGAWSHNIVAPRSTGFVLHFNGVAWREAARGLKRPSGIALSEDGAQVFVAEAGLRAIRIFDRSLETGNLTLQSVVDLDAEPFSIKRAGADEFWIAAWPKPLAVSALEGDRADVAPSAIYVLKLNTEGVFEATPVLADTGAALSGATATARLGDRLLIGAPFADKYLTCRVPT
ncbi:MAG: hypothetical protein AAF850_04690 [Pseudomonadota bacterium]